MLLLLAGCSHCWDCFEPCPRDTAPTAAKAPPVKEPEMWAAIADFAPHLATWTDYSADGTRTAPVEWSIRRDEGDAETVVYSATDRCVARTGLVVPVVVDIDVDDGNATQTRHTVVEAFGPDPADIGIYDEGVLNDDVVATFSEAWISACAEADDRGWGTLDETWILYGGSFARMELELEGGRDTKEFGAVGVCWIGELGVRGPAEDTGVF